MVSRHRLELIRRIWREKGAAATIGIVGKSLRDGILGQHRTLFAMTGEKAAALPTDPGLGVRRTGPQDLVPDTLRQNFEDWRRVLWWDLDESRATGAVTWEGLVNGMSLTFAQTRRGDKVDAYFFPMTERCALISHCATLPTARGKGLYVKILRHVARALAAEGATRIYIDCTDFNFASERGIRSAGFAEIGRGVHRRSGALVWWQETPPSVSRIEQGKVLDQF